MKSAKALLGCCANHRPESGEQKKKKGLPIKETEKREKMR